MYLFFIAFLAAQFLINVQIFHFLIKLFLFRSFLLLPPNKPNCRVGVKINGKSEMIVQDPFLSSLSALFVPKVRTGIGKKIVGLKDSRLNF